MTKFNLLDPKGLMFDGSQHIVTKIFNRGLWFMVIRVYGNAETSRYSLKRIVREVSAEN